MEPKKKKKNQIYRGHYCRVCGQHKANEKFTGGGHAAHVCKACQKKTPAERSEQLAINRLDSMRFRRLSPGEIKWLEKCMNDSSPKVQEFAQNLHESIFHPARKEAKKDLHIDALTLSIRSESGMATTEFHADTSGKIVKKIFANSNNECVQEETVTIDVSAMRKLFDYCVHKYEISFWDEDFGGQSDVDSLEEDEEEYDNDFPDCMPYNLSWGAEVKYSNGNEQKTKGHRGLPMPVDALFLDFIEYFEKDELAEEFYEENQNEENQNEEINGDKVNCDEWDASDSDPCVF
jgi:hypothetical protein